MFAVDTPLPEIRQEDVPVWGGGGEGGEPASRMMIGSRSSFCPQHSTDVGAETPGYEMIRQFLFFCPAGLLSIDSSRLMFHCKLRQVSLVIPDCGREQSGAATTVGPR